jgi:hypothetical protein
MDTDKLRSIGYNGVLLRQYFSYIMAVSFLMDVTGSTLRKTPLQTNNFSGDGFLTEYVNVNLFIIWSHDTMARISIENKPKINSSTLTADNNNTSSLAEGYDPTSLLFIVNSISREFVVPEDSAV